MEFYEATTIGQFLGNRKEQLPPERYSLLGSLLRKSVYIGLHSATFYQVNKSSAILVDPTGRLTVELDVWEMSRDCGELKDGGRLYDVVLIYDPRLDRSVLHKFADHGPPEAEAGLDRVPAISSASSARSL